MVVWLTERVLVRVEADGFVVSGLSTFGLSGVRQVPVSGVSLTGRAVPEGR